MNLKDLKVKELSMEEMKAISGGRIPKVNWKKIKQFAEDALVYLGVADALDEFVEGWNSVDCSCN